jgi:glutamate N-acetyltransferase/amino-acid N-acetyltransferase
MAVGLKEPTALLPVGGVRLGAAAAGIRYQGRDDLVLMEIQAGTSCAAVFTRNAFCAAPVTVARLHLAAAAPRYLLINSGNANAGTGDEGIASAIACCREVSALADCDIRAVLPFSTGVIGEPLPVHRFRGGISKAMHALAPDGWLRAARAIMTTDTVPKGASRQTNVPGGAFTVTGIAKGAGMIRPDMATMLAFLATDAGVTAPVLERCLAGAVESSFNRISVDGDTSTNDACVDDPGYEPLRKVVAAVCTELAHAIVRDGEGATRFITVEVTEGATTEECLQVAYTIAHSPLVKTACFAGDPNWGRILAAVGRASLDNLVIERVRIHLDDVCIVEDGGRSPGYAEELGRGVMKQPEFAIRVALGRGQERASLWTTDLSYDYVRINAEYRS